MTKPLLVASAVALLLPLGGCMTPFSGYPQDFRNTKDILKSDQAFLSADVRDRVNSADAADRAGLAPQQYRDTVVYRRLEVIDQFYYEFEKDLTGVYSGGALSADLTVLVLSGLGSTTGSSATKAALAAASAGVIGAKSAVNTEIFYQKALPALVAQMRADRKTVLAAIVKGLSQPVSAYSLDAALNDVNGYYVAGTLPSALTQITVSAGAASTTADNSIKLSRSFIYQPPTSSAQRLITWLYPGGDASKAPDALKLGLLTQWMGAYTADPRLGQMPYLSLLRDPSLEADRAAAIANLNIP